MTSEVWDVLDAELLDTLQVDRMKRGLDLHVRTDETRSTWPRPNSRVTPTLICVYCGRSRCTEHRDLPRLDPHYTKGTRHE